LNKSAKTRTEPNTPNPIKECHLILAKDANHHRKIKCPLRTSKPYYEV